MAWQFVSDNILYTHGKDRSGDVIKSTALGHNTTRVHSSLESVNTFGRMQIIRLGGKWYIIFYK